MRKIHRALLYIVFATIGYLFLAALLSAAEIYEFPFREAEPINAAIFLVSGIPLMLLSIYIVLIGSPVAFYFLGNPFVSRERLDAHFKVKLDERHYESPRILVDNLEMKITIRRKVAVNGTKIFAIAYAEELSKPLVLRVRELIEEHLGLPGRSAEKVSLTILLCTERDSGDFSELVRTFSQNFSQSVVTVGFDFEDGRMSFLGKIGGLIAGNRKPSLKSFLAMLPDAQKYLDQEYLEGRTRKNRDQIVWPVNPKKIPGGIRFLWCVSCFGLALLSFAIGVMLISQDGLAFAFFAVIIFIYGFFMIGVGVYQIFLAQKRHCN